MNTAKFYLNTKKPLRLLEKPPSETSMELGHVYNKTGAPELDLFRSMISNVLADKVENFTGELRDIHKFVSEDDINPLRLECFKRVNSELNWDQMVLSLCGIELRELLGNDLLIQTKINLSIQMPNDRSSILPLHSDCWSADTPFQMNLWIPLTRTYSTNSMFLLGVDETLRVMEEIVKGDIEGLNALEHLNIEDEHFVDLSYGQVLIFNPALLHGNVENLTNDTRVSLNVRLKSAFAPEPSSRNPDRRNGTYYKILALSENSEFALKFLETGILK